MTSRPPSSSWPKVARVLAVLLTWVLVLELAVRGSMWVPGVVEQLAHKYGPPSSALGWLHRKLDRDAPSSTRYDAELGWTNVPGVYTEYGLQVTVDEGGFRVGGGTTPPAGARTWVLSGDSFTFGTEADDTTHWAGRLAASLPQERVVNLGVSGFGLDQAWMRYKRHAEALSPDVLVVGFNAISMQRTMFDFFLYAKPTIAAEQGVWTPSAPVPPPEDLSWALTKRPHLPWLLEMWRWRQYETSAAFRQDGVARAGHILNRWFSQALAAGTEVWLVYLPMPFEYSQPHRSEADITKITPERAWYQDRCSRGDLTCIDLLPAFLDAAPSTELNFVAHWTAEGHALVVDALRPHLPTAERASPDSRPTDAPPAPSSASDRSH